MIQSTPPTRSPEQPPQPVNSNSICQCCQWLFDLIQSALEWLCCCCYSRNASPPNLDTRVSIPRSSELVARPLTAQSAFDTVEAHFPQVQQWLDRDGAVGLTIRYAVGSSSRHHFTYNSQLFESRSTSEADCQRHCQNILADFQRRLHHPNFEYRIEVTVTQVNSWSFFSSAPPESVTYLWQNAENVQEELRPEPRALLQ